MGPNRLELQVYLMSFSELVQRPRLEMAVECLESWSKFSKKRNTAAAACYYLTHFVIPGLQGLSVDGKRHPHWVERRLFHPVLESINSWEEWLSLFPGTQCEAIYEREADRLARKGTKERVCEVIGIDIPLTTVETLKTQYRGLYCSPNGHSGERSSENVDSLNACFADFDGGDKVEQLKRIKGLALKPSVIVESGHGYHAYWLFDRVETDKALWVRIQSKIIEVCKSDPRVKDPCRLMRVPFSWHTKEEPFFVTIKEYNMARYSLADMEIAFPPAPIRVYIDSGKPRELCGIKREVLRAGQRHDGLVVQVGRTYARLPMDKALSARLMLKEWYQASCSPLKSFWEQEVDDACDWTETKEYGAIVSR